MNTNFSNSDFRPTGAQSSGAFNPGQFKPRDSYLRKSGSFIPAAEKVDQICDDGAKQVRRDREGEVVQIHTTARAVSGVITPGKAQAIAITGQRYLETLKVEAEAIGYEKMLGLSAGETANGVLPNSQPGAELLQGVPQREVPRAAADESGLSSEAEYGEEAMGSAPSGPREGAPAEAQTQDAEDIR